MHPSLDTLAIVPICPHTLSNRPIVLPADKAIDVSLSTESNLARITYDGHSHVIMHPENHIRITRYPRPVTLLHPEDYDYFEVLRAKLFWSQHY